MDFGKSLGVSNAYVTSVRDSIPPFLIIILKKNLNMMNSKNIFTGCRSNGL